MAKSSRTITLVNIRSNETLIIVYLSVFWYTLKEDVTKSDLLFFSSLLFKKIGYTTCPSTTVISKSLFFTLLHKGRAIYQYERDTGLKWEGRSHVHNPSYNCCILVPIVHHSFLMCTVVQDVDYNICVTVGFSVNHRFSSPGQSHRYQCDFLIYHPDCRDQSCQGLHWVKQQ